MGGPGGGPNDPDKKKPRVERASGPFFRAGGGGAAGLGGTRAGQGPGFPQAGRGAGLRGGWVFPRGPGRAFFPKKPRMFAQGQEEKKNGKTTVGRRSSWGGGLGPHKPFQRFGVVQKTFFIKKMLFPTGDGKQKNLFKSVVEKKNKTKKMGKHFRRLKNFSTGKKTGIFPGEPPAQRAQKVRTKRGPPGRQIKGGGASVGPGGRTILGDCSRKRKKAGKKKGGGPFISG